MIDVIRQRKDDFYEQYDYLKPEWEKNGWEKLCDGCKKAGEWCREHWKIIVTVVLVVVAVVLMCTGVGGPFGAMILRACEGLIAGAAVGGILGGLSSIAAGRSFFEGFESSAFSGALMGIFFGSPGEMRQEHVEEPVTMYNLQVAEFHTYYAGSNGILVHNTNYPEDVNGMQERSQAGQEAEGGAEQKPVEGSASTKGLIGHDFEDYLSKTIGRDGSFSAGGRNFDSGVNNRWWEAKSGDYWNMLEENPGTLAKFKSDRSDRLRISVENGATYELFSNTPIPESIK